MTTQVQQGDIPVQLSVTGHQPGMPTRIHVALAGVTIDLYQDASGLYHYETRNADHSVAAKGLLGSRGTVLLLRPQAPAPKPTHAQEYPVRLFSEKDVNDRTKYPAIPDYGPGEFDWEYAAPGEARRGTLFGATGYYENKPDQEVTGMFSVDDPSEVQNWLNENYFVAHDIFRVQLKGAKSEARSGPKMVTETVSLSVKDIKDRTKYPPIPGDYDEGEFEWEHHPVEEARAGRLFLVTGHYEQDEDTPVTGIIPSDTGELEGVRGLLASASEASFVPSSIKRITVKAKARGQGRLNKKARKPNSATTPKAAPRHKGMSKGALPALASWPSFRGEHGKQRGYALNAGGRNYSIYPVYDTKTLAYRGLRLSINAPAYAEIDRKGQAHKKYNSVPLYTSAQAAHEAASKHFRRTS